MANIGKVNFDHPDMFDWQLLKKTLTRLRAGQDVVIPDYNYVTCKRNPEGLKRPWSPLVLVEGIFALYEKEINDWLDLKIFVHTDDDLRLARRLMRDILERGRTIEGVLKSYHRFVKPAFEEFVRPTMKYADIIVPRGRPQVPSANNIAIDFIVHNLEHKLVQAGYSISVEESPGLQQSAQRLKIESSTSYIDVFSTSEMKHVLRLVRDSNNQGQMMEVLISSRDNSDEWSEILSNLTVGAIVKLLTKHLAESLLNVIKA